MELTVRIENYTPEPVKTIAKAAALCYNSKPSKKIVEHCIKSGHLAVTEFADFIFRVDGLSRISSQQLTRHRIASFTQRSQRYVDEDGAMVIIPPSIQNNPQALQIYNDTVETSMVGYSRLTELGIPKEDARFLLINGVETKLYFKFNFRELMHFCGIRLCSRAQWEIRKMAELMVKEISQIDPFLGQFLMPKCEVLGVCTEAESCGKF